MIAVLLQRLWDIFGSSLILLFALWTLVGLIVSLFQRHAMQWNREMMRSFGLNFSMMLVALAALPFIAAFSAWLQDAYAAANIPAIAPEAWAGMPIIIPALFAVFAIDFVNYWHHRLMHTAWYWPVHAVHHSDTGMNYTTVFRVHLLEILAMKAVFILSLSWLGLPPAAIAITSLINSVVGQYVHLNLRISHGPLDKVIASPQVHRWHHANAPEAYGKNLANFFSFLDVLFGTYYNPEPCKAKLGITDGPDQNVLGNILLPLTEWRKYFRKRASEREAKRAFAQSQTS